MNEWEIYQVRIQNKYVNLSPSWYFQTEKDYTVVSITVVTIQCMQAMHDGQYGSGSKRAVQFGNSSIRSAYYAGSVEWSRKDNSLVDWVAHSFHIPIKPQ